MENLVFIEPGKSNAGPFTSSDVVARFAHVSHHAVQQITAKYESDLKELGVLAFEMRKPEKGSEGGRPETVYHYNEPQATLLITYLKNTEPVRAFKKELVKQFYAMRTELMRRQIAKMERKPIRKGLTDGIKLLPDSPHKERQFGNFTNLIYKIVLGKTAKQIREERGAPKRAKASDFLTSEELTAVTAMEYRATVLLELGMNYGQIKSALLNLKLVGHVA